MTIISPNRVFGDYIANVIPELGEEPIFELGFAELAQLQLEGVIGFVPESDPLDTQDEKIPGTGAVQINPGIRKTS